MNRNTRDTKRKGAGLGPESDPDMIRTPSLDEGADEDEGEGEDGTLLADAEDMGAWNEDEEEGSVDPGGKPGDSSAFEASSGSSDEPARRPRERQSQHSRNK